MSGRLAPFTPLHTSRFGQTRALPFCEAKRQCSAPPRPSKNEQSESMAWPVSDGLIAIIGFIVAGVTSGMVVRFMVVAAHL